MVFNTCPADDLFLYNDLTVVLLFSKPLCTIIIMILQHAKRFLDAIRDRRNAYTRIEIMCGQSLHRAQPPTFERNK